MKGHQAEEFPVAPLQFRVKLLQQPETNKATSAARGIGHPLGNSLSIIDTQSTPPTVSQPSLQSRQASVVQVH